MSENEEAAAKLQALHELSERDPLWAQRVADTMAFIKEAATGTPISDK